MKPKMLKRLLCFLTFGAIHDGKVSYSIGNEMEDGSKIDIGHCRVCGRVWTERND